MHLTIMFINKIVGVFFKNYVLHPFESKHLAKFGILSFLVLQLNVELLFLFAERNICETLFHYVITLKSHS